MTDITVAADVSTQVANAPDVMAESVQTEVASAGEGNSDNDSEAPETETPEEPFPKKAVNALNRAKREKRQLRAQVKALEAQLSELRNSNPTASMAEPDVNGFETFTDFNKANVEFQIKKAMEEAQNKGKVEALESQRSQLIAQRNAELSAAAAETAKQFPDLPQVVGQYAQQLNSVGQEIAEIIYEMDNSPLAVYTLAKEGILEDVLSAPPAIAAVHLLNAQARGEQQLSAKRMVQTPAAPAPIRAAKGTGTNSKPLHALSGDDIMKWLKS